MRWAIRLGRIAGTEVRIHITFFLLLAWFAMLGYNEGGRAEAAHWVIIISLVFLCVLLHEFGHATAARYYGIRTPDITLFPFGGVARIERMPERPVEEIVVALAGPMVNVVIAGVLWLALAIAKPSLDAETFTAASVMRELVAINVMLLGFNLIPAFPMDGGRVLRALLATRMEHVRATQIAARIGQMLAVGLGMFGLFGMPAIPAIGFLGSPPNAMLILVAVFVFMAAANEAGAAEMKSVSRGLTVSEAMVTTFKALPRNASLREATDILLRSSQHEFPVVDPDGMLRGLFTRNDLVAALGQSGPEAPVVEAMREDFPIVHPRTPFDEAFQLMQQRGCPVLPVTDADGKLVGLFTLENIGELMMVRGAIAQSRRHS